jgi:CheY-specific phosphatase CheX
MNSPNQVASFAQSTQVIMRIKTEETLEQLRKSVEEVFLTMLDTEACLIEAPENSDPVAYEAAIDIEAVVEFTGQPKGAVLLRATHASAADIEDVEDALGECANMVTGAFKSRVLDPRGNFQLGTPTIDTRVHIDHEHRAGNLLFKHHEGHLAVEIWLSEENA